ncbi:molybdenum cofactor guanylyltransferase [Halomicrobium zhouii]|uniref:Probable molybdenum cofactor guanylyltransferase n=1 Tax=Halomicrobium zhouii TaxID=767519 RepID=A0A1I6K8F2_9EURY|nr:molybdenum cofactor guanylyltransferase [Halomicrobium zhouii]SFR87308.1 molybdenum cofactor guanylyltransferase [Halomicrobium zhouii]
MTDRSPAAGVVLAGGYSTRFGERDKALAPVDGTPMLRRVVDRVGRVTDAVVVNCRAGQREEFATVLADCDVPVAFAVDAVPDEGPLVGLAGALAVHDAPETVLVACDMPFVDPAFLSFLREERAARDADAAVPSQGEDIQPAQAVLGTRRARRAVRAAIAAGQTSLQSLYDRLETVSIDEEAITSRGFERSLVDVNTRDVLAARCRRRKTPGRDRR